jgi:hypothetical protein
MSTHLSIRLGISSCLLGEAVRYDGGHKRDPFLVQTLGPMVDWVPVCPEVEVGLGTPRETIRLSRDEEELMAAMAKPATRARHTNTLQHAVGHFRQTLDRMSRRELASIIEDYRQGLIPLIVPLTLISHHARRLDVSYLLGQRYLDPELKELMLRNHV